MFCLFSRKKNISYNKNFSRYFLPLFWLKQVKCCYFNAKQQLICHICLGKKYKDFSFDKIRRKKRKINEACKISISWSILVCFCLVLIDFLLIQICIQLWEMDPYCLDSRQRNLARLALYNSGYGNDCQVFIETLQTLLFCFDWKENFPMFQTK